MPDFLASSRADTLWFNSSFISFSKSDSAEDPLLDTELCRTRIPRWLAQWIVKSSSSSELDEQKINKAGDKYFTYNLKVATLCYY